MEKLHRTLSAIGLFFVAQAGFCLELNGELKFQQIFAQTSANSLLSSMSAQDYALSQSTLRIKTYHQTGHWEFDLQYLIDAEYSDEFPLTNGTSNPPSATRQWFDLETNLSQSNTHYIDHKLDRASIHYLSDQWVFKLGRQAITWGNGILFHPMDLFNPFSPAAKDTSYKPGIDMAYAQVLFDSGADLQMLWRPGKNQQDKPDSTLGSTAAKYLFYIDRLQIDLMLAQDYQQNTYGVGVASPIGEAVIKLDIVSTESDNKRQNLSWDINLQHSWQWDDKPLSGYIEYFHNGFSDGSITALDQLTTEQISRLQRGQSFTLGENYIALGIQLQWAPLVIISPSLIHQLDDNSQLILANIDYNLSDTSRLLFGLTIARGKDGTEYGGLYITSNSPVIAQPANQLYMRYEWYF
jgi:hypothetical protein